MTSTLANDSLWSCDASSGTLASSSLWRNCRSCGPSFKSFIWPFELLLGTRRFALPALNHGLIFLRGWLHAPESSRTCHQRQSWFLHVLSPGARAGEAPAGGLLRCFLASPVWPTGLWLEHLPILHCMACARSRFLQPALDCAKTITFWGEQVPLQVGKHLSGIVTQLAPGFSDLL